MKHSCDESDWVTRWFREERNRQTDGELDKRQRRQITTSQRTNRVMKEV